MGTADIRQEIEDFLYREADLLDAWHLTEWAELFTADGRYLVHDASVPSDAAPETTLFYIADDQLRVRERVKRLGKRSAIAEFPHSRTRHFATNIRIDPPVDDEVRVRCNLLVHRWRERTDVFCAAVYYRLVRTSEGLKIREKRCQLDSENLREQGRVSIIL